MKKKTLPMVLDSNGPCKLNAKPKRNRKLPRKDIIDADFASPASSRLIDDLLLIRIPSQHDRVILSELWGNDAKFNGFNSSLPHVSIGKPKRSEIPSHTTTADNLKHYKTYKDKLLETKQNASPMDLSNLSLIPSFAKEKKQQYDFEQDAIGVDYTDDFDDALASNEHVNKDETVDTSSMESSPAEENQRVDPKQSQDTIDNAHSEQLPLDEADHSKDSNKDEDTLASETDINQKRVDIAQTKETDDNLEENNINLDIEQPNAIEPEKKLICNTCIDQAGPESDSLASLDALFTNDTEKYYQQDSKEACLDQEQSVSIAGDDVQINDCQPKETSPLMQSKAVTVNNDQDLGKGCLELEINTNAATSDPKEHSISQEFNTKLEILTMHTNDTLSVSSTTLDISEHKEAQIDKKADTHAAEPSLVDQIQVGNNTIITAPSAAPDKLQEDSRLGAMDHQSSSSEEDDDDDDESWMQGAKDHRGEECGDNVYEKIFQIMSVPKPIVDPKAMHKVTISTKPSIIQKLGPRKENKRFLLLKNSAALHWIENGRDTDKKKKMLGIKRKRQLCDKLERPYITKKRIKSCWIVE